MKSNNKLPHINRLIERLNDNTKTILDSTFTYYNKYGVKIKSNKEDTSKTITIIDISDGYIYDGNTIAKFETEFKNEAFNINFIQVVSKELMLQIHNAYKEHYSPCIKVISQYTNK